MATVIPIEDLRRSPTAALFEGRDEAPVSIFVTQYERGQGPALHVHPYPEVFVVRTGTAVFTVGGEELTVSEGHIVIAPGSRIPATTRSGWSASIRARRSSRRTYRAAVAPGRGGAGRGWRRAGVAPGGSLSVSPTLLLVASG